MNTASHYDVVIIGCGMSGLAAGIRLAHFGRRVCIFERHNAPGGLNSFYSIRGRRFDVGLHALTNFVRPGVKGTPLVKLLRQLRIDRDELALGEQFGSAVSFGPAGETRLRFTNDFSVLEADVADRFPAEIDGFRRLARTVREHDDTDLAAERRSAREVIREHLRDPLLEDMLLCPLMYYGSAEEADMDYWQFCIMFRAIFLEGFARPAEGVRRILRILLDRYRQAGGERRMKCGVRRIIAGQGRAQALELDSGESITADHVLSSVGKPETDLLLHPERIPEAQARAGRLSFVETISVFRGQLAELGWDQETIVFFNDSDRFTYARPDELVDPRSGVICFPNNFSFPEGEGLPEGLLRVTCLANYDRWTELPEPAYRAEKERWFTEIQEQARRHLHPVPGQVLAEATVATDMFTPRTITHYTGHLQGAVYGAPEKMRTGATELENLYLCGTDQGYLGIIGAMLSGISMANLHVLRKS